MSVALRSNAKLILLICLSLLFAGCGDNDTAVSQSQNGSNADAPILKVNVLQVSKVEGTFETSVFFGTLKPNRQSQLRFGRAGRIKTMLKEAGQELQSGEQIASLDMAELEQRKSDLESTIQRTEQDSEASQANVQQLRSELKAIQIELEKGYIVTPYDCVIATQNTSVGDLVSPQTPIVTVLEKLPVRIQANLPLDVAQRLNVGTSVWVAVGSGAVQAEVKGVSPLESTAGSRTVSFEITGGIETTNWSFGQTVKIRFLTPTDNTGYWIPTSALSRESTGLWSALIAVKQSDGESSEKNDQLKVQRKMLELIQLEDNRALVKGSLQDGELVIVNGAHRIVPGQRVETTDVTAQFAESSLGASE